MRKLAELIYEKIHDPRQRQILRFLATSEDGLRLSSLYYLKAHSTETGRPQSDKSKALSTEQEREMLEKAKQLVAILPRLCALRGAGPWPLEDPPERTEKEPEIEFLAPYRVIFEDMLLRHEIEAAEFRKDNALTAQLTRKRAKWLRVNANTPRDPGRDGTIRAVQGLARALVAIDPEMLSQAAKDQTPQPLQLYANRGAFERAVFSAEFRSPRELADRFRFLFFEVFRNDIDRGHRLSLEHQRDGIRLNLLLGFSSVGWPVYVGDHSLSPRFQSWGAIQEVLTVQDCVELLVSVAISAARVGVWPVLQEAVDRANLAIDPDHPRVKRKTSPKAKLSPVSIQRVYRRYIDFAILTCGREMGDIEPQYRIFENLDEIHNYADEIISRYKECLNTDKSQENYSANIKMRAALGEILIMKGKFRTAFSEFQKAAQLEQEMTETAANADVRTAWPPSALAGQAARRYMWLLCERAGRTEEDGQEVSVRSEPA